MAKRLFLTPPAIPAFTECRGLAIPASQQWQAVFSEALLSTTYPYNYEQVNPSDLTPEAAAAAAYEAYVAWLSADCAGGVCPPPVMPDGQRIYRKNPATGNWEYVADDGETWVEPTGEDAIPPPTPRGETLPEDKLCAAATNAVAAYYHLWLTLLDQWNTQVEPTVAYAAFAVETGLTLGGAYYPPLAAAGTLIGAAFGIFFALFESIIEQTWNEQFLDALTCIFLDNATLNPDNTVTLDHNHIIGDINSTFWAGTQSALQVLQFTYIMGMVGAQGTNSAGGLTVEAGDCSSCGEWCYRFDFATGGAQGWSAIRETASMVTPSGTLTVGGWEGTIAYDQPGGRAMCVQLFLPFPSSVITGFEVVFDRTNGQFGYQIYAHRLSHSGSDGVVGTVLQTALSPGIQGVDRVLTWTGEATATSVVITLYASVKANINPNPLGSILLKAITLRGTGVSPFGESNCG